MESKQGCWCHWKKTCFFSLWNSDPMWNFKSKDVFVLFLFFLIFFLKINFFFVKFELIVCSHELVRNNREILCILHPVFPNGSIFLDYNLVSQLGYWFWYRQDAEHLPPHKHLYCCPLHLSLVTTNLYSIPIICHFKNVIFMRSDNMYPFEIDFVHAV